MTRDWPLCPMCGEDELMSIEPIHAIHRTNGILAFRTAHPTDLMSCLRCGWRGYAITSQQKQELLIMTIHLPNISKVVDHMNKTKADETPKQALVTHDDVRRVYDAIKTLTPVDTVTWGQ